MKTKIERHSRSVISVLLAVCMLVSCMTVGMIMTDAAKVDGESVGGYANHHIEYNSAGSGDVYFNSSGIAEITPTSTGTMYFHILRDDWGNNGYFGKNETINADGTEHEMTQYTTNWVGMAVNAGQKYTFQLTQEGTTVKYKVTTSKYVHWGTGASKDNWNTHVAIDETNGVDIAFPAGESSFCINNKSNDKGSTGDCLDYSTNKEIINESFADYVNVLSNVSDGYPGVKFRLPTAATVNIKITNGKLYLTFPEAGPKTYYYKGTTDGWVGTQMTETSTSGEYSVNVKFTSTSNVFKFYDSGNTWYGHQNSGHSISTIEWGSSLLSPGADIKAPGVGTYTLYFRPSDKKAYAVKDNTYYTITCNSAENGTLSSSAASATDGSTVTITANPASGYTLKKLVVNYNNKDYDVTTAVSNNTYTLTMPASNVTVTATFGDTKTIYFNNYVTQWSKVYAYTGSGSKPGTEMTQIGSSSIYTVEIPNSATTIIFSGSGGSNNEGGTITCNNRSIGNDLPPDAKYNEYKATNTSSGADSTGTWSEHSGRSNVYDVTPGTSLNNSSLYSNISATLYDYYTNGEYNYGWIDGIAEFTGGRSAEYSRDNGDQYYWNPYKIFDTALSDYAESNSITYPLYFGNLNITDAGEGNLEYETGNTEKFYNWCYKINNSTKLSPNTISVTGLANESEGSSTVNHSNGTAMAMFDEDWLSRENSTGNPLATILHSSAFPVRIVSGTTTDHKSYTYYEFDSTKGKDNAYIQNVDKTNRTATFEYSTNDKVWSAGTPSGGKEGFFPFDNMTGDITNQNTGSDKLAHDLGFGMKLEIPFTINQYGLITGSTDAQTFNFSGDDDLWVYIDGKLVLDLGGAHKQAEGSINFNTKTATSTTYVVTAVNAEKSADGDALSSTTTESRSFNWFDNSDADAPHTMTIYYMERGMYDSNLKFNFSFHAIKNLYTTEKKVRTRNINSGFYDSTVYYGTSGISKFEKSYQDESFTFDQKVSNAVDGTYADPTPASDFTYSKSVTAWSKTGETKSSQSQTYTATPLQYSLTNDDKALFNGKFNTGDYFWLAETANANNKYKYTPRLTVYDDTDSSGNTKFGYTTVSNGSYKFRFDEDDGTGMQTVNVRARVENEMESHTLTLTKSIGEVTDTTTSFPFYVLFNFAYEDSGDADNGYEAYPLYISSSADATKTQLTSAGLVNIKAGETITITGIPNGANIKIVEGDISSTNYAYAGMTATGADATAVRDEQAVTLTMGSSDVAVTARNNDNTVTAIIRVKYAPSYDDFVKGKNISNEPYEPNGSTFFDTTVNLGVKTNFTDETYKSRTNEQYSMTEKAVMNASDTFKVSISNIGAADKLFIGWYDEDGNRWNNTDATQHNLDAKATKAQNRVFEARFITKPTYRIDYDVPTRLWGKRIYKKFGTVDNSMINDTAIGYDSSRDIDQRYYITSNFVETNIPYEKVFLKNITWEQIENGKTATQYGVSKTVTSNTDTLKNVETTTGTVKYDLYRYQAATVEVTKVKVDMYNDCSNLDTCTAQYECDYGASVNNNETVAVNIPDGYTFHRWKIETLHSLGGVKDETLVTYDYSKNFNYVAYDNYKVTAEYIPKTCDKDYNPAAALNPSDPYHSSAPVNTTTVINLGQTRSHWNDTTDGLVYVPDPDKGESTNNTNANYNYDRMFVDLALSYSNGNETKLNTLTDCQVGFKIQYYKNYKWNDWFEVTFSSTELDDKNRIEYYYGFLNSEANRGSKMKVQPTINGVESGNSVEFQFNDTLFTA